MLTLQSMSERMFVMTNHHSMHKSMKSDIVVVVICFKICHLMTEVTIPLLFIFRKEVIPVVLRCRQ